MKKCETCGKRRYTFRNQKLKNIKIKYCPTCKKVCDVEHNQTLDFENDYEKDNKKEDGLPEMSD